VVTTQLRRERAKRAGGGHRDFGGYPGPQQRRLAPGSVRRGARCGRVKSVSYGLAPIAIRGLGGPAGGGSLFTDQPVAVYVDGVYVPALGQSVSDFLDLDTLQVLRGPQGTLYGRNSRPARSSSPASALIFRRSAAMSPAGYASFDVEAGRCAQPAADHRPPGRASGQP
jgi:hypothetical protein